MRFSIAACVVLGFLPSYADHSPETNQVISIEIGDGYVIEQLSTGEECSIVTCDISVDQDGIATSNELVPDLPVLPGDESATNAFAVTLLEMLQILQSIILIRRTRMVFRIRLNQLFQLGPGMVFLARMKRTDGLALRRKLALIGI